MLSELEAEFRRFYISGHELWSRSGNLNMGFRALFGGGTGNSDLVSIQVDIGRVQLVGKNPVRR